MRLEQVEIYSDATNAAVLRHPGRRYPGCLIQGDSLFALVQTLRSVQDESGRLTEDASAGLTEVAERLGEFLEHYRAVLAQHDVELPFHDPLGT